MSKLTSLAIGLLAVISMAPISNAMTANGQALTLGRSGGELQAQTVRRDLRHERREIRHERRRIRQVRREIRHERREIRRDRGKLRHRR